MVDVNSRAPMGMGKRIAWAIGFIMFILGSCRVYRELVPQGAAAMPWVFGRVEGAPLASPDGKVKLRVSYNDAGAAHSGPHAVWVTTYSVLAGLRVVAQGVVDDEAFASMQLDADWSQPGVVKVKCMPSKTTATGWVSGKY